MNLMGRQFIQIKIFSVHETKERLRVTLIFSPQRLEVGNRPERPERTVSVEEIHQCNHSNVKI